VYRIPHKADTPAREEVTLSNESATDSSPSTWGLQASDVVQTTSNDRTAYQLDDLYLLHHWTVTTSKAIVQSSHAIELWQELFPQIGFRHEFLLRAILSLSALHLAHVKPEQRQVRLANAAEQHNQALQGFRKAIHDNAPELSDAVFACASVNIIYGFGMFGRVSDTGDSSDLARQRRDRVLSCQWVAMIRGVTAVLNPIKHLISQGPLAPLLRVGNWEDMAPDVAALADDQRFKALKEVWATSSNADTYDETLWLLRKCLVFIRQPTTTDASPSTLWGYNGPWSGPNLFIVIAPEHFFIQVKQRQPHALLLLAYFGTILYELDGYWFLNGWGRDIVSVVDDLLGEYWSEWIAWPKSVVGMK
jgi:hypothetical protein